MRHSIIRLAPSPLFSLVCESLRWPHVGSWRTIPRHALPTPLAPACQIPSQPQRCRRDDDSKCTGPQIPQSMHSLVRRRPKASPSFQYSPLLFSTASPAPLHPIALYIPSSRAIRRCRRCHRCLHLYKIPIFSSMSSTAPCLHALTGLTCCPVSRHHRPLTSCRIRWCATV